jgi:sodium/proline symporter
VISKLSPALNIYELLPAFIISCLMIFFVSLATPAPSKEIEEEFERAKELAR